MTRDSIHQLLRAIGIREYTDAEHWVNCTCPFARWRHGSGQDTRPSFGISVNDLGVSVYSCFGCMDKAKAIPSLLPALFLMTGTYPWAAAKIIMESGALTLDEILQPGPWERPEGERREEPIPREVFVKFPLLRASNSMTAISAARWIGKPLSEKGRGIPTWVQNYFGLRVDEDRDAVVFPLTNHRGRIYLMRERRVGTKEIWTVSPDIAGVYGMEFARLKDVGVWFGLHLLDWNKPVMLVEGEFDAMRIFALGFRNVVASTTSSVTEAQIDAIRSDSIILGYDPDKAGEKARERITKHIGGKAIIRIADWTRVGRKDGGALGSKEELREVMNNLESP